jgi:hypothetical protein
MNKLSKSFRFYFFALGMATPREMVLVIDLMKREQRTQRDGALALERTDGEQGNVVR